MSELEVGPDGRYLGGEVPFGYALWGDYLIEVPAELDACVTMIRLTRQGRNYDGDHRGGLCAARRAADARAV